MRLHVKMGIERHVFMRVSKYLHLLACMVYMYVKMNTYEHDQYEEVYIYTYIHAYIHTCTRRSMTI